MGHSLLYFVFVITEKGETLTYFLSRYLWMMATLLWAVRRVWILNTAFQVSSVMLKDILCQT
jgi:hypothetical protein